MKKLLIMFAAAIMLLGVQNASASVKLKALAGSVGGDRNGSNGGNANEGSNRSGGAGIVGNLTVNGGTVTATGGAKDGIITPHCEVHKECVGGKVRV